MKEISYHYKVIWSETYIGIAIDKIQGKKSTFPLTTFYFWPRENGWKLLKSDLESKPWMTEIERIEILNGFAKILDFWVINSSENLLKIFRQSKNLNFSLLSTV